MKSNRPIIWNGISTENAVSYADYFSQMKAYGAQKARSVRTSRKYLRSLGLQIDHKGMFVTTKSKKK